MYRNFFVLGAGAIIICLALTACGAQEGLEIGTQAPEIAADTWYNTETLTLEELRGKIVVVEFWATWCPPCRKSIPHLIEVYNKYKDKGVVIIGLSNEKASKIKDFVTDMKMTYPVGAGSQSGQDYGVRGIPHAYVVDTKGIITWKGHPMSNLEEAIDQAIAKTPPEGAAGTAVSEKGAAEPAEAEENESIGGEIDAAAWFNSDPLTLKELKGKIVVLEFWATWCPPCRKSIPHLIEMHNKYKDKGVVMIGLSKEDAGKVKEFVDEMGMTYVVGAGSGTGQKYGVKGIPHAFVLDTGGSIVWNGHPMAGLDAAIEEALKNSSPDVDTVTKGSGSRDSVSKDSAIKDSSMKGSGTKMSSTVIMETSMGTVTIELWPDKAPITVKNFLRYVDEKFYDDTIFHRVISNFMVQCGGFTADMKQKDTHEQIKNEARKDVGNKKGTLAMARTNVVDSATSQFFINVVNNDFLTHKDKSPRGFGYCVFGKVSGGMDVVEKIKAVKTGNKGGHQNVPVKPVVIKSIRRAAK